MRNDKLIPVAGAVLVAVMLGGCTTDSLREDFGKSTALNLEAQAVNPNAGKPAAEGAPVVSNTVDGQKVEKAMERYRADKPEATRAKLLSEMGN